MFNDSSWEYVATWKPAGFGYTMGKDGKQGAGVYQFNRDELMDLEITGNIHDKDKK
jgi:hypothetical protein